MRHLSVAEIESKLVKKRSNILFVASLGLIRSMCLPLMHSSITRQLMSSAYKLRVFLLVLYCRLIRPFNESFFKLVFAFDRRYISEELVETSDHDSQINNINNHLNLASDLYDTSIFLISISFLSSYFNFLSAVFNLCDL